MPASWRSFGMTAAVALAALSGSLALAQSVTGQWDFNGPDGFAATIGADGSTWTRSADPNEFPIGYPQEKSSFGLASEFGVPFDSGDGGVIKFDTFNPFEGIDVFPGMDANGGGNYVNQYTVIMDVYYPADSMGGYVGFYQTNSCNENDSEFFMSGSGGIGISSVYEGQVTPDAWHRIVASIDLANEAEADPQAKSSFGSASGLGAALFPDGLDGGVIQFSDYNPLEAIDAYHGIPANGGGDYVNNYTVVCDIYINSLDDWGSLFNTNGCNSNDGDIWIAPDGFLGHTTRDAGPLALQTWYRIAIVVDGESGELTKYIDGAPAGTVEAISLDGRMSLYPAIDETPLMLFADNSGETLDATVSSVQIRSYPMTAGEVAALGNATSTNIPGGTGVVGQWDFEDPADGLVATTGEDLEWYNGTRCGVGTSAPLMSKYIDGVLVGEQILDSGADGRWALETAASGLPAIFFTDNDGETAPGYCGSIQMRNYAMDAAEVANLGAATAGNIPGGTGVTVQLDFDDPNDGLAATVGDDADWFTAERCHVPFEPGDPASVTEFGLASALGVPLPDGDGGVMHIMNGYAPNEGLAMYHGLNANGGGAAVNEYTLIFDVYFPVLDWSSFYQISACNEDDGDFFLRYDGGIGISGDYQGAIQPNTWHRVVLAVDMHPTTEDRFRKYIDGTLVGTQDVGALDGRWSLFPASSDVPVLLFADENDENIEAYVSSVQIRDGAMTDAEIAALGGVSAGNIPGHSSVSGQWDFESFGQPLAATTGQALQWFTGELCIDCPQDLSSSTQFGPAADFGGGTMPDGEPNVMYFDATQPCAGYLFPHGAEPNGGGANVNLYTVIMDVYFPIWDYFGAPLGHNPSWIALYQTWPMNDGDAMLWIRTQDGAIGDDGNYASTAGWIYEDEWVRVVAAVDNTNATVTKYVIYADDNIAWPPGEPVEQPGNGVDGKRSLQTDDGPWGEDILYFFTDENYETHRGLVSSIQVRDYVMTEEEVIRLGGPRTTGIPQPLFGDLDLDDDVDVDDALRLLGCLSGPDVPYGACSAADIDRDKDADLIDVYEYQLFYSGQ